MTLLYSNSEMVSLLTLSSTSKKSTPESLKAATQISTFALSGYYTETHLNAKP